jgi:predicted O-methyltransferase YrrM
MKGLLKTNKHDEIAAMKATSGVLPDEGQRLAYLAAQVPERGIIVEIGSCQGRSAAYMAAALDRKKKVKIFCVDLWILGAGRTPERHHDVGGYMRFVGNLRVLDLFQNIIPIMADSVEAGKRWRLPIDLLFIDGGHQFNEVKADYKTWAKFVKPGGVIVFHDYASWQPIKRFVDGSLNLTKEWEFLGTHNRLWSARKRGD